MTRKKNPEQELPVYQPHHLSFTIQSTEWSGPVYDMNGNIVDLGICTIGDTEYPVTGIQYISAKRLADGSMDAKFDLQLGRAVESIQCKIDAIRDDGPFMDLLGALMNDTITYNPNQKEAPHAGAGAEETGSSL